MNDKLCIEAVAAKILVIRGKKVMLDRDLAELYGVKTKVLSQNVKRNGKRFPNDFMYQLTREEFANLRSQFVTSSWGGKRYLPCVFTEQGVAMLSSVLNSERAIEVNIAIMRAFIRIREVLATNTDLAAKIDLLEKRCKTHDGKLLEHDSQIAMIFEAVRQLLAKDG